MSQNNVSNSVQMSLDKLQSSSFQAMCAEVSSHLDLGTPSFSAASSFLQNAGQSQIITQVSFHYIIDKISHKNYCFVYINFKIVNSLSC